MTDSFSLGFFHSLKTFDSSALWVAPFCIFAVQFLQLETRKTEGREGKERVCGHLETRLSGVATFKERANWEKNLGNAIHNDFCSEVFNWNLINTRCFWIFIGNFWSKNMTILILRQFVLSLYSICILIWSLKSNFQLINPTDTKNCPKINRGTLFLLSIWSSPVNHLTCEND